MRQMVSIDIDPSDYLDGHDVAKAVMSDALDMLASGRADTAASILANALGKAPAGLNRDPEEDRRILLSKLFEEWQREGGNKAGGFWEWSHGRRKFA